jgi:hypothetical protein
MFWQILSAGILIGVMGFTLTVSLQIRGKYRDKYRKRHEPFIPNTTSPHILNLNSVNQLIFVMVKCGVLFEVRTEFLNNI